MSLNFVEVGDECSYHEFIITNDGKVILDGKIELNIEKFKKEGDIVHIKTTNYHGNFGTHMNVELNYFYLNLIIDTTSTTGDILFGSNIMYGYNMDNSHLDLLSQTLITKKLYDDFKVRFDLAYGEEMRVLPVFLNHMLKEDGEKRISLLQNLLSQSYPLKQMCNPLEDTTFQLKHNWMIVRNTEKGPNLLEQILVAILESKNQQVFTHYSQVKSDLTRFNEVDVFVVINTDESVEYDVPSNSYCIVCPDAFYQSSRRLLRNLPKVANWINDNGIPDRTVTIKDLNLTVEGGEGGCGKGSECCQNKGDGGGCCGSSQGTSCGGSEEKCEIEEKTTEVNFGEDSGIVNLGTYKSTSTKGCCQGKSSGCCKSPDATVEDKSQCGTGNCKGGCKN